MSVQSHSTLTADPRETAEAALEAFVQAATPEERAALLRGLAARLGVSDYPALSSDYPSDFTADAAYKATLPDLQNGPAALIRGARREIQHVGISGFHLPLRYATRAGGSHLLETHVTGSVSLEAEKKGINMSRIMRSFYAEAEATQGFDVIDRALSGYLDDLESEDARIALRFRFPMEVESLRSGLSGWQYYDVAFEQVIRAGTRQRMLHLDYVYSSTCPCSLELSEHARRTRGQLATPHSQRSVARLSVELLAPLAIEDLVDHCRAALPTETQVMVKREDEQAFAELNAANPIFVEDAVRLLAERLEGEAAVGDFRVAASHQESLHSHDAISVLTNGPTFEGASIDPRFFATLVHAG